MPTVTSLQQAHELVDTIAQEVLTGYRAHSPHYHTVNGEEKGVKFTVHCPSLEGVAETELRGIYNLDHSLGYNEKTRLRKGHGIIIWGIEIVDGCYTGNVLVKAALDEFDI